MKSIHGQTVVVTCAFIHDANVNVVTVTEEK